MLVAGASGYVLKDSDGDEILTAVRQAVTGGGVLSPEVTPAVIDELTEALGRERRRTRQLEIAQQALLERAARRHELISRLGHELRTPVTVILGMAQTLAKGTAPEAERGPILESLVERANGLARSCSGSRPPWRQGLPDGPTSPRSLTRSPRRTSGFGSTPTAVPRWRA